MNPLRQVLEDRRSAATRRGIDNVPDTQETGGNGGWKPTASRRSASRKEKSPKVLDDRRGRLALLAVKSADASGCCWDGT